MSKRITRKLTDVIAEVTEALKKDYNVKQEQLDQWILRAKASEKDKPFPVSSTIKIDELWIDYEVQRDVIYPHIIKIMKYWDARICSPVSACRIAGKPPVFAYDGQHRTISAGILGFASIPCAVVETLDPNFASFAFEMLNETGVRKLTPSDMHRNSLVRYKNGSRDKRILNANTLQEQFDNLGIDLEDKMSRKNPKLRGTCDYYFSHFKYAYKGIELDPNGNILTEILNAIKTTYPADEEIDQGVFIGLYELARLNGTHNAAKLPADWMQTLLASVKPIFPKAHIIHSKAKEQYTHVFGGSWNAPIAMSNFLRELHELAGGTLRLPKHSENISMQLKDNAVSGLIPEGAI